MSNPLETQVGGDHYKSMAIQPIEFSYRNGLDPLAAKVIKYVSRWRTKGGVRDLHKAIHVIELLIHFESTAVVDPVYVPEQVIPVREFIEANRIPSVEATVINLISAWREAGGTATLNFIISQLQRLILEEDKPVEWPADDSRIDTIGPNGNCGLHYAALRDVREPDTWQVGDRVTLKDPSTGENLTGTMLKMDSLTPLFGKTVTVKYDFSNGDSQTVTASVNLVVKVEAFNAQDH